MTSEFDSFYPSAAADGWRRGLPFEFPPAISDVPIGRIHCSASALDSRGRIGERSALRALGWGPGQCVEVGVDRHIAVVRPAEGRRWPIGPRGYLHLPAAVRHGCHLFAGDRVLLIAALDRGKLLVLPMAAVAGAVYAHSPDLWEPADGYR
ncbi:hypothetical protein [Nocardia araoensis]|uniref:hypothetical protein n=1 Tax=Nocardia araoensis TaxID=228600 RepID=UPI000A30BD9F|nr:hypothetical protein [Nocardia araoensis]